MVAVTSVCSLAVGQPVISTKRLTCEIRSTAANSVQPDGKGIRQHAGRLKASGQQAASFFARSATRFVSDVSARIQQSANRRDCEHRCVLAKVLRFV